LQGKSKSFWDNGPWQDGAWAFEHHDKQYLVRKHHLDRYFLVYVELKKPGIPKSLDIHSLKLHSDVSQIASVMFTSSPKCWLRFVYWLPKGEREVVHQEIKMIMDQIAS